MTATRAGLLLGVLLLAGCHGGSRAPDLTPSPAAAPAPAPTSMSPGAVAPRGPADPAPAPVAAPPGADASLYARLGGVDAIRAVVHDFVGRVGADGRINAFFRGVDLANLERLLREQICQATGGPCMYSGRTMRATHEGLNISEANFNALVEDLVAALNQFNVPMREKGELLGALGGLKRDIVGH